MNSVLVTGYDGFIGSQLTSSLISSKHKVIGLSMKKNKSLPITHYKQDIQKLNFSTINQKISTIIHLAALTDINFCEKNPNECFNVNILGTQKILELARKKDSKVIFVSSSHVYGAPKKLPIREDDPKFPISVYGGSKLVAESFCEMYSKVYGLDVTILRLFSVYGIKNNGNDVVSKIFTSFLNNKSIKLGNLYPKRDFIYSSDVISAFNVVLDKISGLKYYNIGTGKSTSISGICEIMNKITNKNINLKSIKSYSRKNEIPEITANISEIKKLGWKPKVSIINGLTKTWKTLNDKN